MNGPYTEDVLKKRIAYCPQLASLRSINSALSGLVNAEVSYTTEIAEVIRHDPSLTTRLLKLVNSVFFGLSQRVTNVEDAIFYLGIRQIRELALATPVIEDFGKLSENGVHFEWESFWQHSIGVAMMTRELMVMSGLTMMDETDYVMGLVHNVGKLVAASVFPDEFNAVMEYHASSTDEVAGVERGFIGWDHAQIGGYYLECHQLPPAVVEAVKFHNNPMSAPNHPKLSAIVQVADYMVRSVGVPGIERIPQVDEDEWRNLESWQLLFDEDNNEHMFGVAALRHTLKRLPELLQVIIPVDAN